MCSSDVHRLAIRQQVNIDLSVTGGSPRTFEYEVQVPDGYRVVSGTMAVASDSDANYDAITWGGYPAVANDTATVNTSDGVYNAWRFQFRVTESAGYWMTVIAERSDEPDLLRVRPTDYI